MKRVISLCQPDEIIAVEAHDVDWTGEGIFVRVQDEGVDRRFFPWRRVVEIRELKA